MASARCPCIGMHVGQINALTQIDLGDYRFWLPAGFTARAFVGNEGLLCNIEREAGDVTAPSTTRACLILQSLWPQPGYIPGAAGAERLHRVRAGVQRSPKTRASSVRRARRPAVLARAWRCARALLSPVRSIHGDVLPVGGINEKIEGWFRACGNRRPWTARRAH